MKYNKRFSTFVLATGLIISISSCYNSDPKKLEWLGSAAISGFPSASAIESDGERIYILGDDAPYLLILDTALRRIDSIRYLNDTAARISKNTKADIESATMVSIGDEPHLYALGSLSAPNRNYLFYFPLIEKDSFLRIDFSHLRQRLNFLPSLNIEGMALAGEILILANRANDLHPKNYLLLDSSGLQKNGRREAVKTIELKIGSNRVIGVSGLYYLPQRDLLLFTASEESTPNALEDGAIGQSYLGWISDFSNTSKKSVVNPSGMFALSAVHSEFRGQKIESVCLINDNEKTAELLLAADNDDGASRLFRLRLYF